MQVDFGEEGQTEHNLLTANGHAHTHTHYDHPGPGSGPAYSPFRHPNGSGGGGGGGSSGSSGSGGRVSAIDSGLDQSTGASRNVHTPMSAVPHQAQSGHLLQPESAGHLAHGFYGDMRNSQTPPASANASPRFSAISPSTQPRHGTAHFEPTDRDPPPRDVSDDTIDHAYAAFILYCNPNFPTTTDTTELVKLFRTPPKSDGNAFSTWALFELIRKFDAKEIKTWTQLALDLGVKPPNTDEGQSTQKVQQYSVRLKRWMRAMHIDAFFEYLLGKQHPYFLQIPPPHQPFPSQGRDGVPLEEDLAIRALDPKFKPKRGRRKADEGDDEIDFEEGTPARKRPQLDTSVAFGNVLQPQSAYPTSAHPNNMHGGFLTPQDPWTAVSTVTPSSANTAASAPSRLGQSGLTPYTDSPMSSHHARWRVNPQDTPHTPHPLSAVTPQSAYPFFDEPQSAVTPSSTRSRSRRRHGPAVSSAWSTNSGTATGKLRGRPPSNRSIRDGPFVTFPANPKTKEGPPIDRNPGNLTPIVERAHSDPPAPENSVRFPPTPASAVSPSKIDGPPVGGAPQKQRLSLQVPPNVGNPVVRLTTPTVLVNGLQNDSPSTGIGPSPISAASTHVSPANAYEQQSMYEKQQNRPTHHTHHGNLTPSETPAQQQPPPPTRLQTDPELLSTSSNLPSAVSLETLNRALAAELIRAPLSGRRKRLRGNEAKRLASAILQPLHAKPSPGSTPPAKVMSDYALSIAISSCLGLAGTVGVGIGGPTGGVRRVECIRFRVGGDGYESPVDEEDDDEESENATRGGDNIKETFDVFFAVAFGGLTGEWVAKGLDMTSSTTADGDEQTSSERDASRSDVSNDNWKSKFLDAQSKLWEAREEVSKLKDKILEAVL